MPRKQKKYHYIYKTTCQVTGKFYVGMHSTDNLEDGYIGSGKILCYSISKHGKENHVKEILEFCSSRDELKQREKEIVNEELLQNPLNINLKYGGEGGWDHIKNSSSYKAQQEKAGLNGGFKNRYKWSEETEIRVRSIISKSSKITMNRLHAERGQEMANYLASARLIACSKASIEKRKNTFKARDHMKGEKNSQFGTCWINDGIKAIKIKKELLDEYLIKGYFKGRKIL